MRARVLQDVVAGMAALALILAVVGPCLCLLDVQECHRDAGAAEAAHACCEEPAGVQAVADECCSDDAELIAAATDVPEVSPPALQTGLLGKGLPTERATPSDPTLTPPPPAVDKTTVLLI